MADSNRNRNSKKGSEKETRKGTGEDESISTRGDTANGKYSRTGIRDEDIDNDDTRGGL